jgi:hypothetical protein
MEDRKIYLLERLDLVNHDEMAGIVVLAKNAKEARIIAQEESAVEGTIAWTPKHSTCKQVKSKGKSGYVLKDVNWG